MAVDVARLIEQIEVTVPSVPVEVIGDRVLVLRHDPEESQGGILLPDGAKQTPCKGTVVASGPGTKDEPMVCSRGDIVHFGKYAGQEVTAYGHTFTVLRQDDVLLIEREPRLKE